MSFTIKFQKPMSKILCVEIKCNLYNHEIIKTYMEIFVLNIYRNVKIYLKNMNNDTHIEKYVFKNM